MAPEVESIPRRNNDNTKELVFDSTNCVAAQDSLNETANDFDIFDDSVTNHFASYVPTTDSSGVIENKSDPEYHT